jgi:hypothetical protein
MSVAVVTLPDGRKARVTFDTQEQLDATINDLTGVKARDPNEVDSVTGKTRAQLEADLASETEKANALGDSFSYKVARAPDETTGYGYDVLHELAKGGQSMRGALDKMSLHKAVASLPAAVVEPVAAGVGNVITGGSALLHSALDKTVGRFPGGNKLGFDPNVRFLDRKKEYDQGIGKEFQPQTELGKATTEFAGALFKPVTDVISIPGTIAEKTAGAFGASQESQEAAKEGTNALTNVLLMRAGVKEKKQAAPTQEKVAPTKKELKAEASKSYAQAESSGGMLNGDKFRSMVGDFSKSQAPSDNIANARQKVTPKSNAVLDAIKEHKGDLSIEEIKAYRELINDQLRSKSIDPPDMRSLKMLKDKLDSFKNDQSNYVGKQTKKGIADLNRANELYARFAKTDKIDKIIEKAKVNSSSPNGPTLERAINSEFKRIATNEKLMRNYSPEEQATILNIVKGSRTERVANWIGKANIPVAKVKVPLVSSFANYIAGKEALKNANAFGEMLRRSPIKTVGATPNTVNVASPLLLENIKKPADTIFVSPSGTAGTKGMMDEFGITRGTEAAAEASKESAKKYRTKQKALPYLGPEPSKSIFVDSSGHSAQNIPDIALYLKSIGLDEIKRAKIATTKGESRGSIFDFMKNPEEVIASLEKEAKAKGYFEKENPTAADRAAESEWLNRYEKAKKSAAK